MTVSSKMAYAALEQSTSGQRPTRGTNALGQQVGCSSSALAHTHMGWGGGAGWARLEGQKDPGVSIWT